MSCTLRMIMIILRQKSFLILIRERCWHTKVYLHLLTAGPNFRATGQPFRKGNMSNRNVCCNSANGTLLQMGRSPDVPIWYSHAIAGALTTLFRTWGIGTDKFESSKFRNQHQELCKQLPAKLKFQRKPIDVFIRLEDLEYTLFGDFAYHSKLSFILWSIFF